MNAMTGGHRRPIRLDNVIEVPGGVVGTDPYRRWGPTIRWAIVLLELPLLGRNPRPFNKRDVVVCRLDSETEMYREGPFTSVGAQRRQRTIVREISADGLAAFLRRRQIEESTIGPVTAPSGQPSWIQEAWVGVRLWWDSLRGGR